MTHSVGVTSLSWIRASLALDDDDIFHSSSSAFPGGSSSALKDDEAEEAWSARSENLLLKEDASEFLQKLPSLSKNQGNLATKKEAPQENVEDGKRIKDQKGLNVLTVAFGRNMVKTRGIEYDFKAWYRGGVVEIINPMGKIIASSFLLFNPPPQIQLLAFGLCPMGNKEIVMGGTDAKISKIHNAYLSQVSW